MDPTQQSPLPQNQPSPVQAPKKSLLPVIIACILVDMLLVGGAVAFALLQNSKAKDESAKATTLSKQVTTLKKEKDDLETELEDRKETTGENNIDKGGFQAVFLKNEQVYFGKITKISETQITLTDIYYLRIGNGGGGVSASDPNSPTGDVSLTKLGNELHGPQDTMYIERKEVNFWENLKDDGQVAKAIAEYEKNK